MSDILIRLKTSGAPGITSGLLRRATSTETPNAFLLEIQQLIQQAIRGLLPGAQTLECQFNDLQGVGTFQQQPGTVAVNLSGQPAVGWIIVATAGNTTLTCAPLAGLVIPFITSQAATAAQAVSFINGDPNYSKLFTASLDPNGVVGKVLLTALTLPWNHTIGNEVGLAVAGTGTSASGAQLGASGTAPAAVGVNAPNLAIKL